MFERRLYFHIDWLLFAAILVIAGIGLTMIYSTTYVTLPDGTGHAGARFWVQLYAVDVAWRLRATRQLGLLSTLSQQEPAFTAFVADYADMTGHAPARG